MNDAGAKRISPILRTETPTRPSKYSKAPWQLVECLETGLVYLENPPAYEDLEEDFAWEKTFADEKRRRREEEPVLSRISDATKKARQALKRPRRIATLPLPYLQRRRVEGLGQVAFLDVGAGDGVQTAKVARFLEQQLDCPVVPVAIEISKAQAVQANARLAEINGGSCVQASAVDGARQLAGFQADFILLSSFLEHELQPVDLLAACRDLLAPEGIVVIKVPNFASWNRRIRQKKWCGFRYPDHVNYFTPKTLRLAIETAGLAVVRMGLSDRFPFNDNMYAVAGRAPNR